MARKPISESDPMWSRRVLIAIICLCGALASASWASGRFAEAPRIVAAWPTGPLEVRVAFDSPVNPAVANAQVGAEIPFETSADPARGARGTLRIAGASLRDDGRTLVLATDPHPFSARYTLALR